MKHAADIRASADDEPIAVAIERARISLAAGIGVEHRVVRLWLMTWGEPEQQPFREWLAAWDG